MNNIYWWTLGLSVAIPCLVILSFTLLLFKKTRPQSTGVFMGLISMLASGYAAVTIIVLEHSYPGYGFWSHVEYTQAEREELIRGKQEYRALEERFYDSMVTYSVTCTRKNKWDAWDGPTKEAWEIYAKVRKFSAPHPALTGDLTACYH